MSSRLILISNSAEAEQSAQKDSTISLVRQSGRKLKTLFTLSKKIPAKTFLLRQNLRTNLAAWLSVLDWLKEMGGPSACFAIDFNHPLRELMLIARATKRFTYSIFLTDQVTRINNVEYALLGSAYFIFYNSDEHVASLRASYVGNSTFCHINDWGKGSLLRNASKNFKTHVLGKNISNGEKSKKILIISYFSGPCRTVGVQRINYWAEMIPELSGGGIEVHLASAFAWESNDAHIHFVPDLNIASLLSVDGKFPKWAYYYVKNELSDAQHYNTLSYYWRYALERYFEKFTLKFDVVLISGNPFSVFEFASFAKRKWYAKVFFDYRDPFANNPRLDYRESAREYAKFVERGYNFQADVCISVNRTCLKYLEGGEDCEKIVIPNGFDERAVEQIRPIKANEGLINFVHAGSLYYDRSPRAILTHLSRGKHLFHHIGSTVGIDDRSLQSVCLVCHGQKCYRETLSILGGADCGVVFVSQKGFETPTKLYDYLAFGLDILICTHGPIKGGAIQDLLRDYPGVFWCKNNDNSVSEFLQNYTPMGGVKNKEKRFARRDSTESLIKLINSYSHK